MRLITTEHVALDLVSQERRSAIASLTDLLASAGRVTDSAAFIADVEYRESQLATGLPGGVAIPHARSVAVTEPSVAFGRCVGGVDWGSVDGPADLIFLIAVPFGAPTDHLAILAKLARRLTHTDFRGQLRTFTDAAAVADLIQEALERS
ncbi:EIIABC-Fru [Dermatophilus congolensis]|uniref:EIIABC-Fru n=1 Tax=Dermatophilus congolensis TaxID=1863 RepID=A0AA46H0I1_9MICO|nr:fructose PTS transporter subunit IIA [Dermatophilus congolensis]STD09513.1 EIIABC-Fru [Dermatophilus congolensis]